VDCARGYGVASEAGKMVDAGTLFQAASISKPVASMVGKKPANSAPVRVDILPGTRSRYSGGGYEVMQQLAMDVTGKPFPQLARELVLGPLSMTRSTCEQPLPESVAHLSGNDGGRILFALAVGAIPAA
jgi:CubicO group peptidase (beta-lactamase class C family)